jgi:hypothetical protein
MLLSSQKYKNFSDELGPVVSDRVGDPKAEDDVLEKAYRLFGVDFGQGPSLNTHSEHVDHGKQVYEPLGCCFEGSQEVQAPNSKGPCDGDSLELLGWRMYPPHKVLTPFARPLLLAKTHRRASTGNTRAGRPVASIHRPCSSHAP